MGYFVIFIYISVNSNDIIMCFKIKIINYCTVFEGQITLSTAQPLIVRCHTTLMQIHFNI